MMSREGYAVAVLGATGLVGQTMIAVLEERSFPVRDLIPLAATGDGRTVRFRGAEIAVQKVEPDSFANVDIALFSAGGAASLVYAPEAARRGCVVVDNSSAWRMDPTVPLVVSQVNPTALVGHNGIVANPNCSTMQLAPLLKALSDAAGLERVVVATYQAVSGAGARAVADLVQQRKALIGGGNATSTIYPHAVVSGPIPAIVPPRRLDKGGDEGRQREPEDPRPSGPSDRCHGGSRACRAQPLGGGPRAALPTAESRSGASGIRCDARGHRSRRPIQSRLSARCSGGR
jgi:aspartate-semialdehyde dehydrogenase